jgi:hypothetical protein
MNLYDPSPADGAGSGTFAAQIATLAPFIDYQGDVTLASAFDGSGTVVLSDWEHSSFDPNADKRPPVGVATISVVGSKVIANGSFFASAAGQAARELFQKVRPLQMSYGFVILESSNDPRELRAYPGAIRILKRLLVTEVSAVALGAGGPDASVLWAKHQHHDEELAAIAANVREQIRNSPENRWLSDIEMNLIRKQNDLRH